MYFFYNATISWNLYLFFLFSHRREKQIWLLRTLEKKMLRKWSREPENWMLNIKLPLSSLHLYVLIANFFVFMVLFPKSHALILQILYTLQRLSLPIICSFISYAFQYFCVLYFVNFMSLAKFTQSLVFWSLCWGFWLLYVLYAAALKENLDSIAVLLLFHILNLYGCWKINCLNYLKRNILHLCFPYLLSLLHSYS